MPPMEPDPRVRVHRRPDRGHYDRATIHAILDEALICHVGFVVDEQPYVIPTIHGRHGDRLFLHGSTASRMLRALSGGVRVCVTATLVDGLVLARSAFDHSMNYRSVVVLGAARMVEDERRMDALRAISEHVMPGRWDEIRQPNEKELKQTTVLELPLETASAKVRTGPPKDDPADLSLPVWAGVVPLRLVVGEPVPDPALSDGVPVPEHVRRRSFS